MQTISAISSNVAVREDSAVEVYDFNLLSESSSKENSATSNPTHLNPNLNYNINPNLKPYTTPYLNSMTETARSLSIS